MRIYIGNVNIASQLKDWKEGFQRNGCEVSIGSMKNHSNIVSGEPDYLLTNQYNYNIPFIKSYTVNKYYRNFLNKLNGDYRRILLKRLIKEHDVFLYIWRGILDDLQDFEIIKDAGKILVVQFVGDDIRWEPAMRQEFLRLKFYPIEYRNYDLSTKALEYKLSFLRHSEKYADLIYSAPNQSQLALRKYGVNNQLINTNEFPITDSKQQSRPNILHLPSEPYGKGTKYVLDAINKLRKKGLDFEFLCPTITGNDLSKATYIPHQIVNHYYDKCDIFIGQLLTPGGGKQERELLSKNKIVMSIMKNKNYETHIPEECPIIDVDPETLADKLENIIVDHEGRSRLASTGREYVEKYHNPVKITARILDEIYTGDYKCPTYQPVFFREKFIPESTKHLEVYNQWSEFVNSEAWYRSSVQLGERAGLIF